MPPTCLRIPRTVFYETGTSPDVQRKQSLVTIVGRCGKVVTTNNSLSLPFTIMVVEYPRETPVLWNYRLE